MNSQTQNQNREIEQFLSNSHYISFDESLEEFVVQGSEICADRLVELSKLVGLLRHSKNSVKYHKKIPFEDIEFEFYDRCMFEYARQYYKLGKNFRHFNTCWSMKAEKTIALGVLAKNQTSNLKYSELLSYLSSKKDNVRINYALRWKNILSKTKISPSGWILTKGFHSLDGYPLYVFRDFIYRTLNLPKRDRVLNIIDSIVRNGWLEDNGWQPDGAVVARSRSNDKYFSLTGRHRIVAAGFAKQILTVNFLNPSFPVISVPNSGVGERIPYPGDGICYSCFKNYKSIQNEEV